jgi:hypothetical protein
MKGLAPGTNLSVFSLTAQLPWIPVAPFKYGGSVRYLTKQVLARSEFSGRKRNYTPFNDAKWVPKLDTCNNFGVDYNVSYMVGILCLKI